VDSSTRKYRNLTEDQITKYLSDPKSTEGKKE